MYSGNYKKTSYRYTFRLFCLAVWKIITNFATIKILHVMKKEIIGRDGEISQLSQ